MKILLRCCSLVLLLFLSAYANSQVNLALNKQVYASSAHDNLPDTAVDGDYTTAWQSDYNDTEWIFVDLGTSYPIMRVNLLWDTAYATDYLVQVSDDAENWITIQTITGNTSLNNDLTDLNADGRYVRIYATARGSVSGTLSGYYLSEFEVYSYPDPPSVAITSPENNTLYNYATTPAITTTADASASNGKLITQVEFFSGNTLLGTDNTAPYSLDLSGISDGTHLITAKATDDAGAIALSSPVTLTVMALAADACSTAPAWSSASVYSNAGTQVMYLGRLYSNGWYSVGQNPLTNSGQYQVWQLVSTCGTGTTINITSPPDNDTLMAPGSVDVHVDAMANATYRVTKVELYSNATLIDTDTSAFFTFNWNNIPAGNYSLTAIATDNAGVNTTSNAVMVHVVAGTGCNAPPWSSATNYSAIGEQVTYQGKVYTNKWYSAGQNPASNSGQYQVWTLVSVCPATAVITSPGTGANYTAPATIPITATATNPSGTVTKVEFYQGTVKLATDSTAPYTYTWPNVAAGSYSLTVKAYSSTGVIAVSAAVNITVTALQGSYTWTGNAGTVDWNTATNWSPNGIPGTNDSVSIISATNYPQLANNTTITDLTMLSDSLDMNSLQLMITGQVKFTGGLVRNGTLNIQCDEVRFAGTTFGSDVTLNTTCGNIYLDGSVFNGTSVITKQGPVALDNDGAGNNTFNGPLTLINNTVYRLRTAAVTGDNFNSNVTFNNNSTGMLDITYNGNTTFAGNIFVNSNSAVSFGAGAGAAVLDSSNAQIIDKTGLEGITFNRLIINKGGDAVTLFDPININTALTLTQGNIISASDDELTFRSAATVSGASDASFVSGPVIRRGAGAFTFPIGKTGLYRPLSIAPTGTSSDAFKAEYFHDQAPYPATLDPSINHISQCEYWTLDRTVGNASTPVTLSWGSNSCGVNNLAQLLVAHWNGTQWVNEGNGGVTGSNAAGTVVTAGPISSFSPFTLASSTVNNPLPIRLLSFTAALQQAKVWLKWSTATESGNQRFEVQRSADARLFTAIAQVNGAGNSTSINNYSTYDNSPLPGTSYYRLKQVDADGRIAYSGIVTVNLLLTSPVILLMPNPASDKATLVIQLPVAEHCILQLTDITGHIIMTRSLGKVLSATADLDLSGYAKGLYILSITTPERTVYKGRLIRQ
ncbi:MAG: Ig-like domain-containing protein [Bacteroidota bacterium]